MGFDALRDPLPDDGIWMSGDLHPAHAFTGENVSTAMKPLLFQ